MRASESKKEKAGIDFLYFKPRTKMAYLLDRHGVVVLVWC